MSSLAGECHHAGTRTTIEDSDTLLRSQAGQAVHEERAHAINFLITHPSRTASDDDKGAGSAKGKG